MNVSVVNGLTEHKTPEQLLLGDVLKLEQLELDPEPPINTFKVKEPDFTVEQSGPSQEFKQPEAKSAFLTQFQLFIENRYFSVVTLPNNWNISNINLVQTPSKSRSIPIPKMETHKSSNNDSSLSDWEIV